MDALHYPGSNRLSRFWRKARAEVAPTIQMCGIIQAASLRAEMAKSVRSLRSKLLFNGGSPNAVRSLILLTRSSSHSVAEVSRTATISPERDRIAASSEQQEQPLRSLSFNDGRNAFRSKTTWEIIRALAIFRLCSFDFLVNRNKEVSNC